MNTKIKTDALKIIEEFKNMPEEEFKKEYKNFKIELDNLSKKMDKKFKPKLLPEPNLDDLRDVCKEYIDFLDSDDYHEDNDFVHYIFEAGLETVYGEKIWAWINSKN